MKPQTKEIPAGTDKHDCLQMREVPEKTRDRLIADLMGEGIASSAWTTKRFAKPEFGDVSLTDLVASLRESGDAINRNDMAAAERMLYAQTVALNAIFGEMARVASCNVFKSPEWADRYLRLALKAQSQSRMTVETLAAMKNPPMVFAKQANIANGHQQVNNGPGTAQPLAPAQETQPQPSKLLESHDVERLDTGAQGAPGRTHKKLAAVGAVDRTKKRDR
jgi:hypothetical protein